MMSLDTALTLVPYLLAAAYALKLTVTRETYGPEDESERRKQRLIATLACVYSVFLLYAAGPEYLLLGCIIYAPGAALYVLARREQGERVFARPEALGCAVLSALAVLGVVLVANGTFSL
jgi:arginine:ornithine antiporter/lysine permease